MKRWANAVTWYHKNIAKPQTDENFDSAVRSIAELKQSRKHARRSNRPKPLNAATRPPRLASPFKARKASTIFVSDAGRAIAVTATKPGEKLQPQLGTLSLSKLPTTPQAKGKELPRQAWVRTLIVEALEAKGLWLSS